MVQEIIGEHKADSRLRTHQNDDRPPPRQRLAGQRGAQIMGDRAAKGNQRPREAEKTANAIIVTRKIGTIFSGTG